MYGKDYIEHMGSRERIVKLEIAVRDWIIDEANRKDGYTTADRHIVATVLRAQLRWASQPEGFEYWHDVYRKLTGEDE